MKEYATLELDRIDFGYISPQFSHPTGADRFSHEARNVFSRSLQTMLDYGWNVVATTVAIDGRYPKYHFVLERDKTAELPPDDSTADQK